MTKLHVLDSEGKKSHEITTFLFEEPVREDIIAKVIETEKIKQPYRPKTYAGMNRSASGSVLHTRHDWKSDRGKGMSRFPKKKMWRRGNQFFWVAAIIPSARGGRRAHPPRGLVIEKKINKKEYKKAILSALTYISSEYHIKQKYSSLKDKELKIKLPLVLDEKILKLKTKDFFKTLKNILGELYLVSIQKKSTRAGIGKLRGRKYKKNSGLLFVIAKDENLKIQGIDIVKSDKLRLTDLASGGARITIFSEKSIKDIEKKFGEKK
ncbi:MAG: 50S ribosomal protein L4 [Nanoarchaeota archaeon]|nr:50S ribosomal protein L4 [Nanoarchaeota archaeon]